MRGIEIDLVLALASDLTLLCGGSKMILFDVRADNHSAFMYGSKMTWFSAGNAVGLVFVWVVEKLTWFSYAGRKSLGFSVSIDLDFVFVWVV